MSQTESKRYLQFKFQLYSTLLELVGRSTLKSIEAATPLTFYKLTNDNIKIYVIYQINKSSLLSQ